jgi:hypothetical protein
LVIACSVPSLGSAQEKKLDAAARARKIAPYVDGLTVAVGHVDATRIDPKALRAQLGEWGLTDNEGTLEAADANLKTWLEAFKQAGGRELFLIVNLDDVPQYPPFVIVPLEEGANARAIAGLLCSGRADGPDQRAPRDPGPTPFNTCVKLGNAVFAGTADVLARVKGMTAAPGPEIAKAFEAAGDTAGQFLVRPTEDSRRIINQLVPKLPQELGGQSSSVLTQGVQWMAVGVESSPRLALKLVIQSENASAAQQLQHLIANAFSLLAKQPELRKLLPNIEQLAKAFTPQVAGDRVVLTLDAQDANVAKVADLLKPALAESREAARRAQSANSLKQMGLALHNFHDVHRSFPAGATRDAAKKPLLSWRVQILPYLAEEKLYREFHLDEAWDSPHNKQLIERMPAVLRCPSSKAGPGKTTYLGVAGKQGVFGGEEGLPIRQITDGTSNTLMVLDVADERAVIWTKPDDWELDPEQPLKGLTGHHRGGFYGLLGDGSVRFISEKLDPEIFKALTTYNGGEVLGNF